jgi:hypothetical protein
MENTKSACTSWYGPARSSLCVAVSVKRHERSDGMRPRDGLLLVGGVVSQVALNLFTSVSA